MSNHGEVVAEARCVRPEKIGMTGMVKTCDGDTTKHPECVLAALTAAGIRCLYVPDEKIKHGARLVRVKGIKLDRPAYVFEATP